MKATLLGWDLDEVGCLRRLLMTSDDSQRRSRLLSFLLFNSCFLFGPFSSIRPSQIL